MRNAGLEEAQAGIKIAERNINNLRHADDTILMAKSEEELKSLLMKVLGNHDRTFLIPVDLSTPDFLLYEVLTFDLSYDSLVK